MSGMIRWEPMRELATMRNMMDHVFNDTFSGLPTQWQRGFSGEFGLALDVAEENDNYIVKASVPGVNPEDIEVTLTDNVLTIRGETKDDQETKQENYHLRERRFGTFTRSVALPSAVEPDKIEKIRNLILPSDSIAYARHRAQHLVDRARGAIEVLADSEAKRALDSMAKFVISRPM